MSDHPLTPAAAERRLVALDNAMTAAELQLRRARDDQCADEQRAYDIAVAAREAAQDHHRTVRDQAMVAMALLRSVSTAFNMSGVS